ncbi:hypothetical protein [Halovibrio sp. HP20-50]|uniref:hypothetical protein n=1 Tax=Halovibrio sp. HP20-59 TaxID=3080275 RepID=UPI00294AFF45|nr:hypothetical protein [Halovibrio sp. HP20-59]MEA2117171.1 hypothetical protein [Halovibrio sp. HP20-59]
MHSETQTDLSQAGLHIAIQDIKDELFDTPECDYAIAQLLTRWGQAGKAEQLLDEMLMKWGTSPEVLALTQRGYTEMVGSSERLADNDDTIRKPQKTASASLGIVAA